MTDGEQRPDAPAWPPPHPSPPLPPPRGYGVPGEPPRDPRWLVAGVVGAVVVVALVVLVLSLTGGGDEGRDGSEDAADRPTRATPSASTTGAPAAYTCWDGSPAADLSACSLPEGAAGLAWVYPQLAQQHCGRPGPGADGSRTRLLCLAKQGDGTRAVVLYRQWPSARDAKRLASVHDKPQPGTHWVDRLYPDEPYSVTVTVPLDAQVDQALLTARPAESLRGEPAG